MKTKNPWSLKTGFRDSQSWQRESNSWPPHYQCDALPTVLCQHFVRCCFPQRMYITTPALVLSMSIWIKIATKQYEKLQRNNTKNGWHKFWFQSASFGGCVSVTTPQQAGACKCSGIVNGKDVKTISRWHQGMFVLRHKHPTNIRIKKYRIDDFFNLTAANPPGMLRKILGWTEYIWCYNHTRILH